MGLWNFLKLKPAKITNEEQLIYDISGAIIAISDITTDELYEHSKIIDKTHAFDITIEYLSAPHAWGLPEWARKLTGRDFRPPHTRGDSPATVSFKIKMAESAPHAWG